MSLELKKPTQEQINKENFVNSRVRGSGTMKTRKVISLEDKDSDALTGMLFGATGSGKTHFLAQLAMGSSDLPPQKILILSTDLMGNGTRTIRAALAEKPELKKNVMVVQADSYQEVDDFLSKPYEGLGTFVPDILVWDGFSFFQLAQLSPYVVETTEGNTNSNIRDSGFGLDKMDPGWQAMKNGTVQSVARFGAIRKPDGTPLHKLITATETTSQKPVDSNNPMAGNQFVDSSRALLQGQGGQLIKGGFDFIIKTRVISMTGADEGKRKFQYVTVGNQNLDAKSRGIELPPTMDADACKVWSIALKTFGLSA